MTLIFAAVFFAYGAIIMKGRDRIYEWVRDECANPIGRFGDIDRIHSIGMQYACTDTCPCNADANDFPSEVSSTMVTSSAGFTNIT